MSEQITPPDTIGVEIDSQDIPDPRTIGNAPHTVFLDPAGAEGDDWDLLDLEWRAEEFAAMDAYERGLSFA